MGIETVVSVIAHDEDVTFRYGEWTVIVLNRFKFEFPTPRHAVDVQLAILYLHRVSGDGDNALDENLPAHISRLGRLGRVENHHITRQRFSLKSVRQLFRDEPVTDVEHGVHGQRRDVPRFGDKVSKPKRHGERDEHRGQIFAVKLQKFGHPLWVIDIDDVSIATVILFAAILVILFAVASASTTAPSAHLRGRRARPRARITTAND